MKRSILAVMLLVMALSGQANAQQPTDSSVLPQVDVTGAASDRSAAGLQSVSPEVWVYMQERQRYDDPAKAVRRKAEQRAAARQDRLEARRWYGLSNSRPTAAVTPFMDVYSPAWHGSGYHAFDWRDAVPVQSVRHTARLKLR